VKVADLAIDDPDTNPGFTAYTFTTSDPRFEADATGLWLKAGNPLDFEALPGNPINVTVTATRNGQSFATVVPVEVTDVVERIADLIASNVRPLTENETAPVVVADLSTVGFGPAPVAGLRSLSFAPAAAPVITVDDNRFEIVDSQLRLKAGIVLDFETTPQIPVTITASHGETVVTKSIIVSITDVNEAPLAILASDVQPLPENLLGSVKVADLTVIDPDTNPAFRAFTFGVSDARFEVRDGGLFLKAGQSIDFEALTENPLLVRVTVSDGAGSVETVVPISITDVNEGGSEGNDRGAGAVRGTTGADILFGLGGHDELFGLGGSDRLFGGQGDDVLIGGAAGDLLDGGAGFDVASYRDAASGVRAGMHNPAVNTGDAAGDSYSGIEGLEGSTHADILTGNNSANDLIGGRGDDHIAGMGGADRIFGGEGDDAIHGQGGNDVIDGGAGNDIMSGGLGGRDWFVLGSNTGHDRILDFEIGTDILDFRGTGLAFDDLVIRQIGADALVSVPGGGASVLLLNKLASSLAPSDTLF
jgi:Ca2+-binding RTX toxin-like protein